MNLELFSIDEGLICGVDEAGRGPLSGPVVAAAVILGEAHIEGLRDSKKLSARQRGMLAPIIKEKSVAWAISLSSAEEIDRINILEATLLAMNRAVDLLKVIPDTVLVDGNQLPRWKYKSRAVVRGDDLIPEISAASILAKTYRDALMNKLALKYPQYGFDKHAGYGTAVHLRALRKYGPCPEHRKTFRPVSELISPQSISTAKQGELL
ncbi:MAG: ribonuclease HII [Burkholderiales bacterium]|nr:ribonuclease HII [Burkholderiales bacterium]